jgi:ribonuclease VapC
LILDTSAVVAVLLKEPSSAELIEKVLRETEAGIGAPTLAETAIVLCARLRRDARGLLFRFLGETSVVVIPFGGATSAPRWMHGCGSARDGIRRA